MDGHLSGCNWSARLIADVALGVLAAAVCVAAVKAQDKALRQLVDAGQQLQAEGRYVEAESLLQSALNQAKASSEPLAIARTMNYLGVVKHTRGDYSAAEALYRSATEICERNPAPLDLAAVLLNQARLAGAEGKFDQAEALCKKTLDIYPARLGPDHSNVADTLDVLGWIEMRLGHYQDAESTYLQSVAIRRKTEPPEELAASGTLNDLGFLQYSLGRYAQA